MRVPRVERSAATGFAALLACALPASHGEAPAGAQTVSDVIFSRYTERADSAERAHRLLSPLTVQHLEQELAKSGKTIGGQAIDLAAERFTVYAPPQRPAQGFGLLVFVPPWQDARLPYGWPGVLGRHGVIFVSAARSGNEEHAFNRREPLALLAADNIMALYPVDPARVYIGGFSGGARIALRLALAYPDLFRGALLNAGSDPIGTRDVPLPPRDLLLRFLTSSRLVYVTGERDTEHAAADALSVRSMHEWCMFNTVGQTELRAEHAVAGPAALDRALDSLQQGQPHDADAAKFTACRAGTEADLAARLQKAAALISDGRRADAQRLLTAIDERFGGLAAPRSVELAARLR